MGNLLKLGIFGGSILYLACLGLLQKYNDLTAAAQPKKAQWCTTYYLTHTVTVPCTIENELKQVARIDRMEK